MQPTPGFGVLLDLGVRVKKIEFDYGECVSA